MSVVVVGSIDEVIEIVEVGNFNLNQLHNHPSFFVVFDFEVNGLVVWLHL